MWRSLASRIPELAHSETSCRRLGKDGDRAKAEQHTGAAVLWLPSLTHRYCFNAQEPQLAAHTVSMEHSLPVH